MGIFLKRLRSRPTHGEALDVTIIQGDYQRHPQSCLKGYLAMQLAGVRKGLYRLLESSKTQ